MSLTVESKQEDGVALLNCAEDMNALTMCDEYTELKTLLGEDWASQRVGLGFSAASYIDSAAIGWLLSLNKKFNADGGKLVLHSMSPSVRRVLTMMRLESVFNLADDQPQAIQQLKASS